MMGGPLISEDAAGSLEVPLWPLAVPGGAGSSSVDMESMVDGEPTQRRGALDIEFFHFLLLLIRLFTSIE